MLQLTRKDTSPLPRFDYDYVEVRARGMCLRCETGMLTVSSPENTLGQEELSCLQCGEMYFYQCPPVVKWYLPDDDKPRPGRKPKAIPA